MFSFFLEGFAWLVSYITNTNIFPRPLNPQEEQDLLERMAEGDEKARHTLIERNLRLVAHIVKKFDNTSEDSDDLISIGTIGLIKAINTFDASRNTRLATYAARCIENEILMHLRSEKPQRSCSMNLLVLTRRTMRITLMDILSSDFDVAGGVESTVEQEILRERLAQLSGRERKVLELRYGLTDG